MKLNKKLTLGLLTTSFLLGTVGDLSLQALTKPYVALADDKGSTKEELSNVTAANKNNFKDEDSVKVIVKLKENDVATSSINTEEGRAAREEATKPVREKALENIKKQGINYKKLFDYDLLFNGFALETTYENAKKIQALDFVDSVELDVVYNAPSVSTSSTPAQKDSNYGKAIDSNNLIDVQPLWDKGYKGQGRVVAVIDSGLDVSHDVLRITDPSVAKYKNKEQLDKAKESAGINYGSWVNDKVVFAFNYNDWNTELKEEKEHSHGMHVSGSAVGNPSQKAPNGDYVAGVAPEAQLIFMRVFSDSKSSGTTSSFIYMKAIEDSIKLGADSINLSLGSSAGSVSEVGRAVEQAIVLARKSGVSVTIAAGNSAVFGTGHATPKADSPDYGLVGNPSVAYDSISVAALYNSVINTEVATVKQLADNTELNNGVFALSSYATKFDSTKDYSYVFVGLGKEEDYQDKDVQGKVVLIKRGEITFPEKIKRAKEHGASGVVIFNRDGDEDTLTIDTGGFEKELPIVSMGNKLGEELSKHADKYTLSFEGKLAKKPSDKANTLTDFTSWGLSADGELKPDVTAPGGNIYSSFNNGTYGSSNGTSMAAPHVAGATALVKQVLLERFPNISAEEMQKLVKHLVMSTANPNYNKETNAYTSPREQGAGVIDTYKAALGDVYVTGTNDYGSLSLGNVKDQFKLNLVVHNVSDTPKELVYSTFLNTDEVKDGHFTLKPRQLEEIPGGQKLTVPAKGQVAVMVSVDASKFASELQGLMPNGYYLEGFVKFLDAKDNTDVASIPYVGFRGEFQNLPAIEKSIYDFTGDDKPLYYNTTGTTERDPENNFTTLLSLVQENGKSTLKVLGEFTEPETQKTYFNKNKLAFSPNDDNNYDLIGLKAVILRNLENLKLSVYKKDDSSRQNPLYESGNSAEAKTFYDNAQNVKSKILDATEWSGKDKDGNTLPDGEYQYVVSYRPNAPAAKFQELAFNVTLDTVAPKIVGTGGVYDEATRKFTPYPVIEEGSGIQYKVLTYKQKTTNESGEEVETDAYVEVNKDGSYTLPEGHELKDFTFSVADFANNKSSITLSKVQSGSEKGTLAINLKVENNDKTKDFLGQARFKITNEKGEVVGEDYAKNGKNLIALPFGKYKVELVLVSEDYEITSPKVVDVELTKDDADKELTFTGRELSENKFTINVDTEVPEGTKIYVVNTNGTREELPQSKFDNQIFEKKLINGDYTVEVVVPEGYVASESNFKYSVKDGKNAKTLTIKKHENVDKNALENLYNDSTELKSTDTYKYDVLEDRENFDKAYNKAKEVLDSPTATQKDVDNALVALSDAKAKLNGKIPESSVNKKDLYDEFSKYETVIETDVYKNSTDEKRKEYSNAVLAAYDVLANNDATQEQVDSALAKLKEVYNKLSEQTTNEKPQVNKTNLETLVNLKDTVKNSDLYVYESEENKNTYDTALKEAEDVLKNVDASQEQVDSSLNKLQQAMTKLNGSKPAEPVKPVVNKDELKAEVAKNDEVTLSDAYKYDENKDKVAYDEALTKANEVLLNADATQEQVDTALTKLREAKEKLNGTKPAEPEKQVVDKSKLEQEVANSSEVVKDDKYKFDNNEDKQNYDFAVSLAKNVLADSAATQELVDKTLAKLEAAKEKLDGKKEEKVETSTGLPVYEEEKPAVLVEDGKIVYDDKGEPVLYQHGKPVYNDKPALDPNSVKPKPGNNGGQNNGSTHHGNNGNSKNNSNVNHRNTPTQGVLNQVASGTYKPKPTLAKTGLVAGSSAALALLLLAFAYVLRRKKDK